MEKEVLVVLGSPNSPSGELSDISKSRLDCCRKMFSKGQLILCTGGWGPHLIFQINLMHFMGKNI